MKHAFEAPLYVVVGLTPLYVVVGLTHALGSPAGERAEAGRTATRAKATMQSATNYTLVQSVL